MTYRIPLMLAVAAVLAAPPGVAAADDHEPDDDERAKIEETLREAGYRSWESIERDDDRWEVDDAKKEDEGTEYDVKIDVDSYEIVSEESES